jgi:hypothetical protein
MPAATSADGTGQAPESPAPQDGTTGQPQDGAADGSSSTGISDDVHVLQQELTRAREQAAATRIELKAIREAEKARADAELSEAEKLTKRQKELEAQVEALTKQARQKTLEAAIVKQAILLGIIDPDAAVKLLDADELELDDETGEPKNVEAALKALIKDKPYLASKPDKATPGSTNAGAGAAAGPAPHLTADELAAAQEAGMTPERYAALKGVKTLEDWRKVQPAKA